MKLLCN